ncbi:MAG: hypothetical protein WAS75_03930 [Candidatus Microthrix subdominans]
MAFDWAEFKNSLSGESDWHDADDLARMSIDSFRAEGGALRRDMSTGSLKLTGSGIDGHSGPIDGVSEALRNFQRLILATGLAATGHTTMQGQPPLGIVAKTRLNLDGSPLPGSLVLQIVPATSPGEEIAPDGQPELFGDNETQLVDTAVKDALTLLDDGRRVGPDADSSTFLDRIQGYGPRVASTLRDFSLTLVKFNFEPDLTWTQPRRPRLRTHLSIAELAYLSELIAVRELEREPTTLSGVLRTVSDFSAWQLEIGNDDIVRINAKQISADRIATLRIGMTVSVDVDVTEAAGPAGGAKPKYTATSFRILAAEG